MLKDLVTIIIPCKNSVYKLKTTIENLLNKTKIQGTRVLVLDFGSEDGSQQYAAQASSDYMRKIKIECIKMQEESNLKLIEDTVNTPYLMIIRSGSISSDKDIIMNSLNKANTVDQSIVYFKNIGIIKNILSKFKKKEKQISYIISKKDILSHVYFEEKTNTIDLNKGNLGNRGILIERFSDN